MNECTNDWMQKWITVNELDVGREGQEGPETEWEEINNRMDKFKDSKSLYNPKIGECGGRVGGLPCVLLIWVLWNARTDYRTDQLEEKNHGFQIFKISIVIVIVSSLVAEYHV